MQLIVMNVRHAYIPAVNRPSNGDDTHPNKCVAPLAIASVAALCHWVVWSALVPQSMGIYCLPEGTVPPGEESQL